MTPRTRTTYKLDEAKFFLNLLEQNWRHAPAFDYFLSAFISAARSVTWVMRSEYGSRFPEWAAWFDAKKPSSESRARLKKMNDIRVRLTKTDPVRTRTTATVQIDPEDVTPELMDFLNSGASERLYLKPADRDNKQAFVVVGDRVLAKAKIESAVHEVPEFEGKDIRLVCREYIRELEELSSECVNQFGPKTAPNNRR